MYLISVAYYQISDLHTLPTLFDIFCIDTGKLDLRLLRLTTPYVSRCGYHDASIIKEVNFRENLQMNQIPKEGVL